MKMFEINQKTLDELKRELEDTQEAFANLRFQKATHQLDNPVKLRHMRRGIARLKTVISEYETGVRKTKTADAVEKKED